MVLLYDPKYIGIFSLCLWHSVTSFSRHFHRPQSVPEWLRQEVGPNKSFDEIRDLIERLHEWIAAEQNAGHEVIIPQQQNKVPPRMESRSAGDYGRWCERTRTTTDSSRRRSNAHSAARIGGRTPFPGEQKGPVTESDVQVRGLWTASLWLTIWIVEGVRCRSRVVWNGSRLTAHGCWDEENGRFTGSIYLLLQDFELPLSRFWIGSFIYLPVLLRLRRKKRLTSGWISVSTMKSSCSLQASQIIKLLSRGLFPASYVAGDGVVCVLLTFSLCAVDRVVYTSLWCKEGPASHIFRHGPSFV